MRMFDSSIFICDYRIRNLGIKILSHLSFIPFRNIDIIYLLSRIIIYFALYNSLLMIKKRIINIIYFLKPVSIQRNFLIHWNTCLHFKKMSLLLGISSTIFSLFMLLFKKQTHKNGRRVKSRDILFRDYIVLTFKLI